MSEVSDDYLLQSDLESVLLSPYIDLIQTLLVNELGFPQGERDYILTTLDRREATGGERCYSLESSTVHQAWDNKSHWNMNISGCLN